MPRSDTDYLKIAFAVLVVALVLRVSWGALVPVIPVSDSKAYEILAHTLTEHGVYGWSASQPSAYWPPGTSAVYAGLYWVFGKSSTSIVVLNIFLSIGIVSLTIWLGCRFFNKTVGILAGVLMAIWPSEVAYVTVLASELPFTFFVLLGGAAWFSPQFPKSVRAVSSGLAFAAATYFRPIALLLPVVLWLSALPKWQKLYDWLPVMLLALGIIVVAVTPWSVRNAKVFGHFVPMSTADGANLWAGNNANADGYFMPLPASIQGLSESDQDKALGEEALRYIRDNPGPFIVRSLKKAVFLHVRETTAVTWNTEGIKQRLGENALFPLKLITQGFWTGVLLFALGGIAILVRRRGIMRAITNPTVLIWIYFTAVYSIFVAADRYHFPSHPFISMLAAIAILATVSPKLSAKISNRNFLDPN